MTFHATTGTRSTIQDLPTPALVLDQSRFDSNVATMSAVRPGLTLRPHVKAHKCSTLAQRLASQGHTSFTCATPREVIGMVHADLGSDLLLANETVDQQRLSEMASLLDQARITVAIDSQITASLAAQAGIRDVLIDINVGLPRCGVAPAGASALANFAVARGLNVRGVMGYEGHLMTVADRSEQQAKVRSAMEILVTCFDEVRSASGPDCSIISAGGTGTFDLYDTADPVLDRITEIQAGSYALMDSHYGALDLPFQQALYVLGTVISVSDSWAVIDVGLKSLGMDHGNPTIDGASVWFCSDEHTTFSMKDAAPLPNVGDRIFVQPAHIDPTIAMHDMIYLSNGLTATSAVIDSWPVDLRGW